MSEDHEPPPRWQDQIVLPLILGLAIGAILVWRDVPLWRAGLIGLSAGVTGFCVIRSAGLPPPRWPYSRTPTVRYSRRNLEWLLSGAEAEVREPDRFRTSLRPRLIAVTGALLDRTSTGLDSAEARRLLGSRNHQLLTDPDCRPPDAREILALVAGVTTLAAPADVTPDKRSTASADLQFADRTDARAEDRTDDRTEGPQTDEPSRGSR